MINAKLYTTASETPMSVFIPCLISGNLKHLKKSKGFIKQSKLKQVWDKLFNEYLSLSGETSNVFLLNSMKEYTVLANSIKLIDDHLSLLSKGYNKGLADNLKQLGFVVDPIKKGEAYIKQLKSINTRAKNMVLRANQIKRDLDEFESSKSTKTVTENDFIEIFMVLSKNQGYQLTPKNTTVLEFTSLIKLYEDKK